MKQMKYNLDNLKNQVFSEEWNKKIFSHLPQNIDEQFKESGSFKRFRGNSDIVTMLKVYFAYAISNLSFLNISIIARALGLANISDTSWRKRLLKIVPFLEMIIAHLLKSFIETNIVKNSPRLLLVDATVVRLQGKAQHLQRVHVCFELNNNIIVQIKVTDEHVAESMSHFSLKSGDIVMGDAAYGTVKNCAYVIRQGADFIFRITPSNFPIYDIMGNRINRKMLLPVGKEKIKETLCLIKEKDTKGKVIKTHYVRVIVARIPENKIKAAQKRKKAKAKKAETIQNAAYVFLVTSLTEESYGKEAITELYRSRWQIELLFKCFKQNLGIKTIRIASQQYAKAMICLWLIIFLITERNLIKCRLTLEYLQENPYISIWQNFKFSFCKIRNILELVFPIDEFSVEDWKRLDLHKRGKRINQNEKTRKNLIPNLRTSGLREAFKKQ